MKKMFRLFLKKAKRNWKIGLVLFVSILITSCGSNSPQKMVVGTWLPDNSNTGVIGKCKIEIKSELDGIYEITFIIPDKENHVVKGVYIEKDGYKILDSKIDDYKISFFTA